MSILGRFDHNSILQRIIYILVAVLCILICFSIFDNVGVNIEYPLTENALFGGGPYIQQFDAFQKGQIELDLPVSDELLNMENPYDTDARDKLGVYFFWDRAFFEGKYYSYFGLAPVLTVFYPYFVITGALPSSEAVCLILAVLTIISIALALWEFLLWIDGRPHFLLLLTALLAVIFGSGVYTALSYSDIYYIPVLSAMAFNFMTVFFALRAYRCKKGTYSALFYVAAAVAFVLSVMSRPTAALMCVIIIPSVIKKIFFMTESWRERLLQIIPAASVLLIGAAGVMVFNYLRFGSLFDFGSNYQLTVSDISENTLTLKLLPAAIAHYIFQLPRLTSEFPFLQTSVMRLDYGRYVYVDYFVGGVWFPASLGLVICPPFVHFGREMKDRLWTFICGGVMILSVAFVDFCKAGVNLRYLYDFLPIAVLLGALLFLRAEGFGDGDCLVKKIYRAAVPTVLFAFTVLMALGVVFSNGADKLFG